MYRTNINCTPAGAFSGPMVVSMRPLRPQHAIRAIQITSRFPAVHGAPFHVGLPELIGIKTSPGLITAIRSKSEPTSFRCSGPAE